MSLSSVVVYTPFLSERLPVKNRPPVFPLLLEGVSTKVEGKNENAQKIAGNSCRSVRDTVQILLHYVERKK